MYASHTEVAEFEIYPSSKNTLQYQVLMNASRETVE